MTANEHMRFRLKGPDGLIKSGYSGGRLAVAATKAATLARDNPDRVFTAQTGDGAVSVSMISGALVVAACDLNGVPPWLDVFRTHAERALQPSTGRGRYDRKG